MAGYTRQSVPDIQNGSEITAPPLNAEFNALSAAFHGTTGHSHDGTSGNSPKINLATSVSGYLPAINGGIGGKNNLTATSNPVATDDSVAGYARGSIWVNTSTNRLFVCISNASSAAVWHEMVAVASNSITPVATNTVDIGSSSLKYKDIHLAGNALIGGTLGVSGDATFANLSATGSTTITSVDLNSGVIDNTVIGNSTAVAGTFTDLTSTGTTTVATADINGGNIDGTIIGASTAAAGTFTNLTSTGTSTHATVDINGGAMDGTTIGASNAAAASFTTVSTSGQATLATVDINGGNIDATIIGANTPAAITGTTVTGTSLVGPVTGNVTGNLSGNVTGNVTGDLTGNVTASSGSSSFTDVTINGTLNMNAGTTATITNLTAPSSDLDAATKLYVDTQVTNLVDSAPSTLDTLNELAAALGDDANFSTTITNSIATKLPLSGGTMSGAIAMATNKITGLGDPTANQDAVTKSFSDTTYLGKAGGTMSGAINMGSQKITTTYAPVNGSDLTNKTYVDTITGSLQSAQTNANAAAASATAAATSETNAANSATSAASSATAAAASYDSFDDRYLGAKSSAPATDNDGDALLTGSLYFNSSTNIMNVYGSGGWQAAGSSVNGTSSRNTYIATAGQTTFAATYDTGFVDCFLNGTKLIAGTDFTATNGTTVVLASGAAANDTVDIVGYGTFSLATHYTKTESDARYLQLSGGTLTGGLTGTTATFSGDLTVDTSTLKVDSSNNRVGIGTSSPSRQLHLSGSTPIIRLTDTDTNAYGEISSSSSDGNLMFYADQGNTQANTTIRFYVDTAERMRIDSGNVLVGKTSADSATNGVQLLPNGISAFGRDGGEALRLNRNTSDGEILRFQKAGTPVGSIGVKNSRPYLSNNTNCGIRLANNALVATDETGTNETSATDLGATDVKWKDAYFSGTVEAGNFNSTSDATLKTNVETLSGSLDAVKALRGVSFDWIDSGDSEVGVIAQEVEEVIPELVSTNGEGIKSVKYGNMVAVLIEAIKEQQEQINELKAQLNG